MKTIDIITEDKKTVYLIESKRYSIKQLKKLIYKRKDKYLLNIVYLYPF